MDVVDTTVFAYALLGEPAHKEEALAVLAKASEFAVPDLLYAEFAEVVSKWVQSNRLQIDEGLVTLAICEPLIATVVESRVLWETALVLSYERRHPVYEALYVALARRERTKVISYDKRLLKTFVEDTIRPGEFLSA